MTRSIFHITRSLFPHTLLILGVCGLLFSCVPKSQLKKSYDQGYAAADQECLELQKKLAPRIQSLQNEINSKNQIIKTLSQKEPEDCYCGGEGDK